MSTCARPGCNKPLPYGNGKFCSRACYAVGRIKEKSVNYCFCGKPIRHYPNESKKNYAERTSCSLSCAAKLKHRQGKHRSKGGFLRPFVAAPVPNAKIESPEEWLKTHEITKCPPAYAWGVQYMNPTVRSKRRYGLGDGEVK